tara:strand:- start:951 stop:2438 length:1488 start_codon:yes stop_codon:yes gene_type:complete
MTGPASFMVEQGGVRYSLVDGGIWRDELNIISGLASGGWSAIKYNQFNASSQQIFSINGTDRKRISGTTVSEWGITAPNTKPVLTTGASTGLTGTYNAVYTYAVKEGAVVVSESNASAAADSGQALSNQTLSVTFTASTDPQVTHVRVYRTLPGGSVYFHDQDIAVGTIVVDSNTADVALGGEVEIDHDRPPAGTIVAGPFYSGVCFIAKDNLLYYCLSKRPEYWPTTNFIEIGSKQSPIKSVIEFGGQVYVLTKEQIWFIQGTGGGAFNPIPLNTLSGAQGTLGALGVEGVGIFHIGADGLYLFSGGRDQKISQDTLEPVFRGVATNGMLGKSDLAAAWLARYENRLYMHYSNGAALVMNLDNSRTTYYKWDQAMTGPVVDLTNDRLYACDAAGYTRHLEVRGATDDRGVGIEWQVESKDYTDQTRRYFPRFMKYDVDGAATGALVLDGQIHQAHTLTVSRSTKRRIVEEGNGRRCSIRISGTGSATVYAAEME